MIFRLSPLRHKLEEAPLMTRALKQDQAEAAYDHYDRVVIRVQFPDRLVLQACFRPRETGESDMIFISAERCNFFFFLKSGPNVEAWSGSTRCSNRNSLLCAIT